MARLFNFFLSVLFGAIVAVPAFAFPAQVDTVRARALDPAFGQPGSKICLSWSEGNDPSLAELKTSHVIGYVASFIRPKSCRCTQLIYGHDSLYSYGVDKPTAADSLGFDFWPMLWGGDASRLAAFDSAVMSGLGTIIIGFNE